MSAPAVAGYEIRRILRDRALPALLILLLALSAYAAWNGADWVRQRNATLEQVRSDEQTSIEFMRKFVATMPVVDRRYFPTLREPRLFRAARRCSGSFACAVA